MVASFRELCKSLPPILVVELELLDYWASLAKEVTEVKKAKDRAGCEHPEKLKGRPGECSPEQIKECHGKVVQHPPVRKK